MLKIALFIGILLLIAILGNLFYILKKYAEYKTTTSKVYNIQNFSNSNSIIDISKNKFHENLTNRTNTNIDTRRLYKFDTSKGNSQELKIKYKF